MKEEFIITMLTWAVPICFGLHIVEEFIWPGGFREWYHAYRPQMAGSSRSYYYKANAVYFGVAVLVALAGDPGGVLIWSGVLLCNLIFTHVRGALKTRRYSPGIVTGSVLYVPLFVMSYSYFPIHHVVSIRGSLICLLVSPLPEIYFALKRVHTSQSEPS